jgi:hypothetical protein
MMAWSGLGVASELMGLANGHGSHHDLANMGLDFLTPYRCRRSPDSVQQTRLTRLASPSCSKYLSELTMR